MSTRNRQQSRSSSDADASTTTREAFNVGTTTLDLDGISDEELDSLSFEDDPESSRFLNLQTMSGISLLLAGTIYLMTEVGSGAAPSLLGTGSLLPWLLGTSVILLGIGALVWRPSNKLPDSTHAPMSTSDSSPDPMSPKTDPPNRSNRLTRSQTDKMLFGVCGGIAEYLDVDPTWVRIAFLIGTVASFGPLLLVYLGLAVVIPKK